MNQENIKKLLDEKYIQYNNTLFIENDPISIPHSYTKKEDKEIMGFFASIFAWGQRITIINKCIELGQRMDNAPFEFIKSHNENDLKKLLDFKHRTFNDTDLLYTVHFLKHHYSTNNSLESAFIPHDGKFIDVENSLIHFQEYFFSLPDAPSRTHKHISSPKNKSACKRLNMYLRWMVRKDDKGVDFGLWSKIKPSDLICPLDLHVERTAKMLGLITRQKADWLASIELTQNLRAIDPNDPVKYDFALFGLSIEEKCMIPHFYSNI